MKKENILLIKIYNYSKLSYCLMFYQGSVDENINIFSSNIGETVQTDDPITRIVRRALLLRPDCTIKYKCVNSIEDVNKITNGRYYDEILSNRIEWVDCRYRLVHDVSPNEQTLQNIFNSNKKLLKIITFSNTILPRDKFDKIQNLFHNYYHIQNTELVECPTFNNIDQVLDLTDVNVKKIGDTDIEYAYLFLSNISLSDIETILKNTITKSNINIFICTNKLIYKVRDVIDSIIFDKWMTI